MSMVIDGKGWSLNHIIREQKYREMSDEQITEVIVQLSDASTNASRPGRRDLYGRYAKIVEAYATARREAEAALQAQAEVPAPPVGGTNAPAAVEQPAAEAQPGPGEETK